MRQLSSPKAWLGLAASALCLVAAPQAVRAESRSYVVSYFTHATSSVDDDCPGGLNPKMDVSTGRALQALSYSGTEVEQLMKGYGDEGRAWDKDKVGQLMNSRARVNGKPANAYAHPEAVVDA